MAIFAKGIEAAKLRRNFSWTFAGTLVYALSQWLILVAIANLGSPEMVGQFALGLALSAPAYMFSNLQLRAVLATDYEGEYRFGHYATLRVLMTLTAFLFIVGLALVYFEAVAGGFWATLLLGAAKAVESFSDIVYGALQRLENMRTVGILTSLRGVSSLVTVIVVLYLCHDLTAALVALVLIWLIIFCFVDVPSAFGRSAGSKVRSYFAEPIQWRDLRTLFWVSLPLGFVMLLVSLQTNFPRYVIDKSLGQFDLGIFAAIAYFVVGGGMVVRALAQVASPRLARHRAHSDVDAFRKLLGQLMIIGMMLGIAGLSCVWLIGDHILTTVYGPPYEQYGTVFFWLMLGGMFSYTGIFLGVSMTALRSFRKQLIVAGLSLIFVVIASVALVPAFGLLGAAWALVGSSILQLVLKLWFTRAELVKLSTAAHSAASDT